MCTQRKKTLEHLYSTHRDAYKALPRPPFGKSDHNSILLIPAYKRKTKAGSTSDSLNTEVRIMRMLRYRTVLLAQTGIGSGIYPMALRSIPPQSSASSISASMMSSPKWPYTYIPTRSHRLQATSASS